MQAGPLPRPLIEGSYFSKLCIFSTTLILIATGSLLLWEQTWVTPRTEYGGQATFVAASVGTEFVPLAVLEVLPDIDPERFPPAKTNAQGGLSDGWIKKYGFIERRGEEATLPATAPELAELLKSNRTLASLPVGFTLSAVRPFQPDPSPTLFVGLACAGCHSARLPEGDPNGKIVYGAGNPSLDLIGFFEAFRGVMLKKVAKPGVDKKPASVNESPDYDPDDLQYALNMESIKEIRKKDKSLKPMSLAEELMVGLWLGSTRDLLKKNTLRDDLPATALELLSPRFNPVGPGRTEPFVTLDHSVMRLPARNNKGYSKIPAVFLQGARAWAQFDGSVAEPNTRSGLAAMTAGGSVDNLGGLGVGHHVIGAADYTRTILVGPKWAEVFSTPPVQAITANPTDAEAATLDESALRGRDVYREHCALCHGRPDPDQPRRWLGDGKYFGKVVPTVNPFETSNQPNPAYWVPFKDASEWAAQATDPERVAFRDGKILPYILYSYFDRNHPIKATGEYYPLDHPLAIKRPEIRNSGGYVNAPLDSLFIRAPFLHNGSVPTLAQLINRDPRPAKFLRGRNKYDQNNVGIEAPAPPPEFTPKADEALWWVFDTSKRGNHNTGHNYPWPYDAERDPKPLNDLLAYLKTL